MTNAFFHTAKLAWFSWILALLLFLAIILVTGRQAAAWFFMKLYELFVQHK